ncbi:MAG TPA: hypothetical protein VGH89_23900 [Pseudonocardia sp.]|jgi:hypothetical protein
MSGELDVAVDAVTAALAALRAEPRSSAVHTAVQRATAAVDALTPDLTAEVLHRLVVSIEDCHRDGVSNSARLAVCRRSTSVALRLDPRWPSVAKARARRPQPQPS